MATISGQRLANLTKGTLTKMHRDHNCDHFYDNVTRKSEDRLGKPPLARKRCTPVRLEVVNSAPIYPHTANDHFRKVYYEAIDLIDQVIDSAI